MSYLILLIGFIMLIKGADVFVDSSSNLARKLGIPPLIIGLTLVAMGTSAPEFSVSLQSALTGMNDISLANVAGSNLFNLLVVLGLSTLFGKLKIDNYKDVIIMSIASLVSLLLALNGVLSSLDGIFLLFLFVSYIVSLIFKARKEGQTESANEKSRPVALSIILSIVGLLAIVWGGNLVVNSASNIALQLGMSQNLIGLTVVAIGTSLPELVTSLVATKKGELDIAVGNVIGSNIFNLLLIIGSSAAISSITVSTVALIDLAFIVSIMLLFITFTYRSRTLSRPKGLFLVLLYVGYIVITIIR